MVREDQNLPRARRLRSSANTPEAVAWDVLRRLRHDGWPVRRQHPIGSLIVDFAIVKARLVIEIDGSIHHRDEVRANDELRDSILHAAGWSVLRIPSRIALSRDALLSHVRMELRRLTAPLPDLAGARSVPPPQAGEG
jgi:very-short-patch-repair endonuclease